MIGHETVGFADASKTLDRVQIGHAQVHALHFSQAVHIIVERARLSMDPAYIVTPNAQHVVLLEADPYLRRIYAGAKLVVADGASLLIAAKLLGKKLEERIAGVDLFQAVCDRAAQVGLRVFLLGGRPGSVAQAATALKARFPGLIVAGTHCPEPGFEKDEDQLQEIAEAIRISHPHIVFVALGAPKQEFWMYEHGKKLGVPICMGIGGAFEMVSGLTRRAPEWLQRAKLEWLFRLLHEPRRLWKRYLIGNVQFALIVFRQLLNPGTYSGQGHARLEGQQ